jgi:hypothetical protein
VAKATQASVSYTTHAARHDERCALCTHFHSGMDPPCDVVQDRPLAIVAGGWCKRFRREP